MDIKKTTQSAIKYLQEGNLKFAEHLFRDILEVQPHNVSALHFIGVIYYEFKDYDSAIKYIRKALQFGPNYVDAYNNLGLVLEETNRRDEAIMCYEKAVALNPNFDRAHYNLGTALKEKWQIDDAIKHYQIALQLNPCFVEAYNNMGLALQDQGNLEEAERYFRLALQMKPDFSLCYSNLLLLMNYSARYDPPTVFSEHLRFASQMGEPLSSALLPHANKPSSARRLRIGYVSPDFRRHSVAYFIEPVLEAHSRDDFEVFCYSDVLRPDNITKRLQEYADQWRSIVGISDAETAELIRRDEIDILVDLAGHTGNNRILVFARKPAPVQVSWLGYPNTTGISTVDYRFVDGYTDPPGLTDPFYTEELIRLPESFLCYLPDKDSPNVEESLFIKSGHVTFGSFNYFTKVSPETVALWTAIMKAIPSSHLILKSRNFSDRTSCKHAMELFTRNDIAAERIELLPINLSFTEHLGVYNRVDIALDTFPYNGTATTCEALWMGVPVITLAGDTHASRVGASLLSNIGLSDLVAHTREQYREIAVRLASDLNKLKSLRYTLRDRVARSPLTDATRFIVHLENCYKNIWDKYCKIR
jgi:protein O-GlcNAc transferase